MRISIPLLFFTLNLLTIFSTTTAQDTTEQQLHFYIGTEVQAYPTGAIPALFLELSKENGNSFHAKFGYNIVRHRDLGVHDFEIGGGYGFTVGYKRYFKNQGLRGFYAGLRSDLWFNKLDWEDYSFDASQQKIGIITKGQSKIIVLQPTIIAGYQLTMGSERITFSPQLAFGWEINVSTKGECIICSTNEEGQELPPNVDVGQGAIFLAGFAMAFKINK